MPAPTADRIANSRLRPDARVSIRLPMLPHAISSTAPTAPNSTSTASRRSPTSCSRSGKDVLQWIEQIPFSETKGYVQRVIENTVVYDQMNASTPSTTVHVSGFLNKHPPG